MSNVSYVIKTRRNYGVDLLRIVSMLLIVLLHILGHGGVIELTGQKFGLNYTIIWFIELFAYPAVDIFVLISGFVGYRNEKIYPRIKNLLSLWIQVVLYGVIISLGLMFLTNKPIGMSEIIKSVLPITTNRYWFFTAYAFMFVISPVVNNFVYNSSRRENIFAVIVSVLIISCYSTAIFKFSNPLSLNTGRSFLWFLELYFIGAVIRKYDIHKLISAKVLTVIWIIAFLLMIVPRYMQFFNYPGFINLIVYNYNKAVLAYSSPLVLVMSIITICIFARLDINKNKTKKVIGFFAPLCFGVYLIHDNILVRNYFISGLFAEIFAQTDNSLFVIFVIIFSAIGIFSICCFIDYVRALIFKLCRIDTLCSCIEKFWINCLNGVYKNLRFLMRRR